LSYRGEGVAVVNNRKLLEEFIEKGSFVWPEAIHKAETLELPNKNIEGYDAVFTKETGVVCVLTMADCLPILLSSKSGNEVAVIHGGWRSLEAGVIENAISKFDVDLEDVLVWLGPAISRSHYEVGSELIDKFGANTRRMKGAYASKSNGKYLLDLYRVARNILCDLGLPITNIYGGDLCAYSDHRFHSVRRDGKEAGRFAVAIWMDDD
jgi:YfiH family protein